MTMRYLFSDTRWNIDSMFIVGIDEWATVGFSRIIKQRTKKHKTKYIKNSTSPFRVAKTSQSNFNVSYGLNDSNANI